MIIYWLLFIISAIGALSILTTTLSLWNRFQWTKIDTTETNASLSVIVPIKGADQHTEEVIRALVQSAVSGNVQYLFTMETEKDPAYTVCKKIQESYPEVDIQILFSGPAGERMGKQHNIAHAVKFAKYDFIACMDADVSVQRDTLQKGLDELHSGKSHVVFHLPYYDGEGMHGGKIVSYYVNYYYDLYMGSIAVTTQPKFIIGALWMLSKETIDKIGGFEQFTGRISDDAAIGEAVVKRGLRNYLLPQAVKMPLENLNLADSFKHLSKWLTMLRAEGVPVYSVVFLMWHPLLWSLLTLTVGLFIDYDGLFYSLVLMGAALLFRVTSVFILNNSVYKINGTPFLGVIIYELLFAPYLFAKNFFRRTIVWKGKQYRLGKHGIIEEKR